MTLEALHRTTWDGVVDILVVAIPAFIAAIGTIYVAKVSRENRARLKAQDVTMDTGNGKDLGLTVHDMAQTVEILSAQVHINTAELLDAKEVALEAKAAASDTRERLEDWIESSSAVHDELLARLPKEDAG